MAKYGIVSLNYLAAGERRLAVNLDSIAGYELSVAVHALEADRDIPAALACEGDPESAALQARLSCCSERARNAVSAFNSQRLRRNRSFVLETGQLDGDRNELVPAEGASDPVLPMYDSVDEAMKTAERKPWSTLPKIGELTPTDDEYVPPLAADPIQFCQVGERSYFMTEPTAKAYQNLRTDVDPYADEGKEFYRARIVDNDAKTYLYPAAAALSAENYMRYFGEDNLSISALRAKIDGFFQPADELRGVEYNHLFGMLHGWRSAYDCGNVYGDTYTLKNMYDATYSMDMESPDRLVRAREYDGMCLNGGSLFLKYRDDVSYERNGGSWTKTVPEERSFQKVERFQPVKSQELKKSMHKSNYFSVRIKGLGLGEKRGTEEAEAQAETLRFDIENAVRRITAALAPANTQLFEVQFQEKDR